MEEEYCPAVEKLLEATAALSFAVEKKPMPQQTIATVSSANNVLKTNKQPLSFDSSLEHTQTHSQTDRRHPLSQDQPSSLEHRPADLSQPQQQNADSSVDLKPQDNPQVLPKQPITSKTDRRFSIASTHAPIANHISSSSQGLRIQ